MNLIAKPINTRFEVYLDDKQFKAVTEYNETFNKPRHINRTLERLLYDSTCAIETELFADLEGGYIFFTVSKADESPAEHKAIINIITQFVSEALDPEMYME